MKYIAILIVFIITAFLSTTPLLAQDSIRNSIPDSIRYAAFDTNVIKNNVRLSNTSETFNYDQYVWSDKRSLAEILDMRSGYTFYNLGPGERNPINFYELHRYDVGYFRDGVNIGDIMFGGIDVENISINEIEEIEEISFISSYLYGVATSAKTINIITKDVFQPEPFSQLRYSQDRYNSLFADIYFSQSFSRKFNLQLGLTKHSSDGRFTNSEFDKWQTRTKLNFYLNPNFNIKTSFYYNKLNRGLFSGLIDTTGIENIADDNQRVVNETDKEDWANIYSNLGLYFKLFRNKNNVTKILFNYQNSLRKIDSLNLSEHVIAYDIKANQNIEYNLGGINGNLFFNSEFGNKKYSRNGSINRYFQSYLTNSFMFSKFTVLMYLKYINTTSIRDPEGITHEFSSNNIAPGIELKYMIPFSNENNLELYGGSNYYKDVNFTSNFYGIYFNHNIAGFKIKLDDFKFNASGFQDNQILRYPDSSVILCYRGLNFALNYRISAINLEATNDTYFFKDGTENFMKANLYYDGFFFNNNLHLKTGFIFKYYTNIYVFKYNMITNWVLNNFPQVDYLFKDVANVDFYIGARIGSANINFTLANLFNKFNYDTYLYPYDDRGGVGNVVSRLTIVWDFLN